MEVSAGLIFTNGTELLVGHSTGNWFYDLPKGKIQHGETPHNACVREVMEETGLDISNKTLKDLGIHQYRRGIKKLHLFLLESPTLPNIKELRYVGYGDKRHRPEFDGYKIIPFSEIDRYMVKSMANVLKRVLKKCYQTTQTEYNIS